MKFELLGKLRDGDEDGAGAPSGELPIDEVQRLSDQGYAETEIIEQLRDRGYAYGDINEALNAAVKESASQGSGMGAGNEMGQDPGQTGNNPDTGGMDSSNDWEPQQSQTFNDQPAQPQQQPRQQPQQQPAPPEPQYQDDYEEDDWGGMGVSPEEEELIEIIVSEHMTDVDEQLDQFRTELNALREDFQELQQQFNEIDIRKDEDEKVVIQKVNEMEDYFEQTSSRMGGMEKALQQVLPSLVENVRDLSTVVREMKEDQHR